MHADVYDNAGNMTYAQPLGYLDQERDAVGLVKQSKSIAILSRWKLTEDSQIAPSVHQLHYADADLARHC